MKDSAGSCPADRSLGAELVLACGDLDAAVAFYVDTLGFRLDMTMPADAPTVAVISGHGISLRLQSATRDEGKPPMPELRLPVALRGSIATADLPASAPGGLRIAWQQPKQAVAAPAESREFLLRRADSASAWVTGRAGMQYRDLIPGRVDGHVIASHIRIPEGGPVPDYVHFHEVGVQLIYCRRGWVRVVYEDQGAPFVLRPGDCVLQPPTIRHRVLESSAGLEVIEVGSPAQHETWRDHELALPTPQVDGKRRFGGQRFVRHVASEALWQSSAQGALRFADTGIADATNGMASVRVLRLHGSPGKPAGMPMAAAPVHFLFVLSGRLELGPVAGETIELGSDDACVLPARWEGRLESSSACEILEVALPALAA
ncbi:cupin domain-containing protein [Dokdonella immobilis]|nr:cupin domain-containing protein [Dokdonella immobilis]